jgi:hypothetical protein
MLEQSIATAPADGLCSVMKTDWSGDVEWSRICKSGGGRWSGFGLAIAEAVDDGGYVIAGVLKSWATRNPCYRNRRAIYGSGCSQSA